MRTRNYLLTTLCPPRNNDGGEGGDGGDGGGTGGGNAGNSYTPPASQDELNEIIEKRLNRERAKYADYDDLKTRAARADALENDLASESEKAVKKAADDARAAAADENAPRLVRQAFRAEAKGVLDKDQLDGLLEDYNPKNYLTADGDVDEEKVAARVAKLAGKKDDGKGSGKTPPRPLGQGTHQQATPSARDLGRAEAEKRFGKKQ